MSKVESHNQRTLRFRAWHEGYSEEWREQPAQYFYDVQDLYDGSIEGLGAYGSFGSLIENEEFIIEQSTGLFDKQGKEIFEGDIVQYGTYYHGIRDDWRSQPAVVSWDSVNAMWILTGGCNKPIMHDSKDLEIIGNVHEDKELLK